MRVFLASILAGLSACATPAPPPPVVAAPADRPMQVGFLLLDGIYNSELVAPMDVFHHTVFHTKPGMEVFTVGRTKATVTSFEGLRILPDFDFDDVPDIDVLVVPSAEHNMDTDLEDERLIEWVRDVGGRASYIVSVCDGAFVLAEAGLLDSHVCTTFPGDLDAFRTRFPELDVQEGVIFVADGKAITGAGGARSYEPAFYLVEQLYGLDVARGIGRGLVIDWNLGSVPHSAR